MRLTNLYNNEAVAMLALGNFLKVHKQINFSTTLLILPFLLHEPTVKRLNSRAYKRSLEEFLVQYPDVLVGFNSRFQGFLPLTINAITILKEAEVILLGKNKITFQESSNFSPNKAGNRSDRITKAADMLSQLLLPESTSSLFLKLKIQL